ncbi:hypothetical protein EVG20_g6482 [Dentipellis fragilis]|uniref:Uncharacterized protein n=1 Tax=Dentipellis fragilis TaxID=205917 RepID=A0A4Y9YN45_9AGAM|nr:hypothetical protein EVG20_g6482 [Dentipellis fragilis]
MENTIKRRVSKHDAEIHKITQECLSAMRRRDKGEITQEEFMRIAHDCEARTQAREAATNLLRERLGRGDVDLEEIVKECGYSDEEWENLRPGLEKHVNVLVDSTRCGRA